MRKTGDGLEFVNARGEVAGEWRPRPASERDADGWRRRTAAAGAASERGRWGVVTERVVVLGGAEHPGAFHHAESSRVTVFDALGRVFLDRRVAAWRKAEVEFGGAAEEIVVLREGPTRADDAFGAAARAPAGTELERFCVVLDPTGHVVFARRGGWVREVTVSPKLTYLGAGWVDGAKRETYEIRELLTGERRVYEGDEAVKLRGGFICDDGCLHGYWEGMAKGDPTYRHARASGLLRMFCPGGGWSSETRDRNRRCADLR